jgi:hypothetical protein
MTDKSSILQVVAVAWLTKRGCLIEFFIAFLTRIAWVTLGLVRRGSGEVRGCEYLGFVAPTPNTLSTIFAHSFCVPSPFLAQR